MSPQDVLHSILSILFLTSVIRISTPIIFSALGGLVAFTAGVPNMALEGIMNIGAFTGVIVSAYTGSVWIAVLAGVVAGILTALLLGLFHLYFETNVFIAGMALNMFASGVTVFLLYLFTGDKGSTSNLKSLSVPNIDIPLIKDIPYLGEVLSGNSVLTYVAFASIIFVYILLYKTRFGIHLRAVGEDPETTNSLGIKVTRTRLIALMISGAFAALGGMFLSMASLQMFQRDMAGGRGWIGIAAVYLGGMKPARTLLAALIFGFADAVSNQFGSLNIPPQLVQTIPYMVTVIALTLFTIRQKYVEIEKMKKIQIEYEKNKLIKNSN